MSENFQPHKDFLPDPRVERVAELEALVKELRNALEVSLMRLGILAGRIDACHDETGRHEVREIEIDGWVNDSTSVLRKVEQAGIK